MTAHPDQGAPTPEGDVVDVDVGVDVPDILAAYGRVTQEALLALLPDGQPRAWLYDLLREYPRRPAKFIRPSLCMATCRAFGGEIDDVLLPSVAIEMLHNAFLVHDDIADGSVRRRGRPTLHATHGLGLALNAGDALALLAQRAVRESVDRYPPDLAERVLSEFDHMMARTLEGQATELGWRRDGVEVLGPEDYLDLIMHKTCWYTTIHPLRVGTLVGAGPGLDVSPMVRFGFYLGAAFQIRDDVLNLTGTEAEYGKEILGDLHEGKRTLMLIHLIGAATGSDRELLRRYLQSPRSARTTDLVESVRELMERHGSIEFALQYAEGIAEAAVEAFETAFSKAERNDGYHFVRALIPYMLDRTS